MRRKILVLLVFLAFITSFTAIFAQDTNSDNIYLHYYRFDNNYTDWTVWGWQSQPESLEGVSYDFVDDTTAANFNFGGKVAIINRQEAFPNASEIGVIIRKGDWVEKDIDADRFITLSSQKGEQHFYFVEGESNIGTSLDDPNGPSKFAKFKSATFNELDLISFTATHEINIDELKVLENNVELLINTNNIELSDDKKSGTIKLTSKINFENTYVLESKFDDQDTTVSLSITLDGVYNSTEFNETFGYDGELGAIFGSSSTTFRLWAPISSAVSVNIYDTGTPLNLGGSNTKQTYDLIKKDKGIFEVTVPGDLHGKYYTFNVTNYGKVNSDIVDPYAKSVGINGLRGMVVDFSRTNPEGFTSIDTTSFITNKTDAVIYELHVRDLTTHETWNGSETNRGKWLGLIESGTKYEGLTTGFDHIKELGITHLQILPFFDYGNAIDETKQDDPNHNSFNWGYMPLNFNAIEGNYSSNPYDGLVRINELKQVVKSYHDAGIKINMDVVYNHTGQSADSNFNLIVPGYYHRFTSTGAYSNGSGTGNETASERYMMRKFIVDSVLFWAKEYKLGGFRFDLMGLHDVETMNELSDKLHEYDPNILVYGEPWMGGTSTLDVNLQAGKSNILNLNNIGAFNDDTRDAIKGSVFSSWMGGFIQGDYSGKSKVKYGITGGIDHIDNKNYAVWHGSPDKTINYVTAHDNNTLHDKLYLSLVEDKKLHLIEAMSMQAHGLILTSQGIPFIHAGDEFLRSKEISEGTFDHNSYQSPDSINQIQWNWKKENNNHYEQFKNLLNIRSTYEEFRMADNTQINQNLSFLFDDSEGLISYKIVNQSENRTLLMVANAYNKDYKLALPSGNWKVLSDTLNSNSLKNNEITIKSNGFYILEADSVIDSSTFVEPTVVKMSTLSIILISTSSLIALSTIGFIVFKKVKK